MARRGLTALPHDVVAQDNISVARCFQVLVLSTLSAAILLGKKSEH